jgi:hypothetical protein
MRAAVRAVVVCVIVVITLFCAVGSVRGVKRHPTAAQFLASAMMLVFGFMTPIPEPPQQGIEEARVDKDKKGSESGDPPTA